MTTRLTGWQRAAKKTKEHGAKAALSRATGIPLPSLSRILSGKRRPSLTVAAKLEAELGIPASDFVRMD